MKARAWENRRYLLLSVKMPRNIWGKKNKKTIGYRSCKYKYCRADDHFLVKIKTRARCYFIFVVNNAVRTIEYRLRFTWLRCDLTITI